MSKTGGSQAAIPAESGNIATAVPSMSSSEGVNTPRVFTSTDPLVGDLATEIEAAYSGHVMAVNEPIYDASGRVVTDADIVLRNAIIQVKAGRGAGLTRQVFVTEKATGKVTIGYGPSLGKHVVLGIEERGGLVTRDRSLLMQIVKPD